MKRLLFGLAPAFVMLVHALAPPEAQAHWFGRGCSYYSPRYSYGYSSCYRPAYYGYSNYGYSNYGYGGYGNYYGAGYGGYGGYGGGFGGNSALTTILAMNGGLGGSNSSMYMTVPMSNGYGPASLLQVPLGGASGRPTYLQVPMGGGPGQPVYLQMELGGGAAAPSPVAPAPRSVGSRDVIPSDRVVYDDVAPDAATQDDVPAALSQPYVVLQPATPELGNVAATDIDEAATVETALAPSVASGPFRFAVFEKPVTEQRATAPPPTVTVSAKSPVRTAPLLIDDASSEPALSDSSVPWKVK